MGAYQELDRCEPGQEAARGRRFNALLAEVLRWGGLRDVVSDQRGLEGRDETDVVHARLHPLHPPGQVAARTGRCRRAVEDQGEAGGAAAGVRPVLLSMSGFTAAVRNWADFHAGTAPASSGRPTRGWTASPNPPRPPRSSAEGDRPEIPEIGRAHV